MTDTPDSSATEPQADPGAAADAIAELPAHPKGTLAILLIYGLLFAVGWAWMYFGEFLSRGATTG